MNGDILRLLRYHRRMGQRELANKAKISKSLICYIENGQRRLTPEVEQRLIEALRVYDDVCLQ